MQEIEKVDVGPIFRYAVSGAVLGLAGVWAGVMYPLGAFMKIIHR